MINNVPRMGDVYRISRNMFHNIDNELATVIDVRECKLDSNFIRGPMTIVFMLCDGHIYPCSLEMLGLAKETNK